MVVAPLCWKANEWVGMTIGCAMDAILESLQKIAQVDGIIKEIVVDEQQDRGELILHKCSMI